MKVATVTFVTALPSEALIVTAEAVRGASAIKSVLVLAMVEAPPTSATETEKVWPESSSA